MAVGLYMDVHVPRAISEELRRRGVDVLTAQEDGSAEFDDEPLLARATALDRILFSQDQDLLAVAARWQREGRPFIAIVFCPQLGPGIGEIIEDLQLVVLCSLPDEVLDRVIYLPLQ
jgi:predicted nuclease of predicted toxin-antitoxin system